MTLTTIAQATKILDRDRAVPTAEGTAVVFRELNAPVDQATTVDLGWPTWKNLGEPDTITVTIERN